MIPTLEDIIRMLIAGECSPSQATAWLKAHEELDAERASDDRRMVAAMVLQGFCANPAVFAPNPNTGWGLVNSTDTQLAGYAVHVANCLLAALSGGE